MTTSETTAPFPTSVPCGQGNAVNGPARTNVDRLAVIDQIVRCINRGVQDTEALTHVMRVIASSLGASCAMVFEKGESGELIPQMSTNPDALSDGDGLSYSCDDQIVGAAIQKRCPQLIGADCPTSDCLRLGDHSPEASRQFVAPLYQADECIGLLVISTDRPDALSEDDLSFVTLVAGQMACCLRHLRLKRILDQTQESLRDQFMRAEKMRTMGEMASGVFHDFNNILGAIVGRVQLVTYRVEDEELKRSLSQIERIALQGAETVKRLQEFSRLHQQQQAGPCDLNRVIDDALEVTRHRWESQSQKRGISYQIDKRLGQDVVVKGMHSQLVDAVANLVRNALDAMDQGGRLSFETTRSGGVCRLSVRDEGRGMTPDEVEQVFAPFFTTKGSEGTGLGMTVVQDIIKSHKGTIAIESTPGVGTVFRIDLPIFKEGSKSGRDTGDHKKVDTLNLLVVDDDHIILDVVTESLEDAGHKVDSFSHGSDAISALEKNEYHVVVTDLGMPDVTGWEVARAAKMHQPQIPVVVISGWGAQFSDDQLGDSGVDAMLAKPFHLQLLRETIERLAKGDTANVPAVRT